MLIIDFIAVVAAYILGCIGLFFVHFIFPIYELIGPAGLFCVVLFILIIKEKLWNSNIQN